MIELTYLLANEWAGAKQNLNRAHEFIVIAKRPIAERSIAMSIIMRGTGGMAVGSNGQNGKMASTIDCAFEPEVPDAVMAPRARGRSRDLYMDPGLKNPHPCTKPLPLIRWLTKLLCPKGGRVLDPFVGSGTGGLAAILEGYSFVGIEQSQEYVELARSRIANCQREMRGDG